MGSAVATNDIANNMDRTAQNTERTTQSQRENRKEMEKTKTLGDAIVDAQERGNAPAQKQGEIHRQNKKELEGLRDVFPQIGNELDKLSQNDLAKALGIETAKKGAEELGQDIQRYLGQLKKMPLDELFDLDASKEKILKTLKELGESGLAVKVDMGKWADELKKMSDAFEDTTMDLNLNSDPALKKLRDQIEKGEPYTIDLVPKIKSGDGKDGNATLEAIRSAVENIKTLVAKIEPKLPQTALAN